MSFIELLLILLQLSQPRSGNSAFERACFQKGFVCVAKCQSRPGQAAKDQCVNSCENTLNNCLD